MRIFLVLICSLALACVASAQQEEKGKKKEQKKGPQAGQVSQQPGGKPRGAGKGKGKPPETGRTAEDRKATGKGKPAEVGKAAGAGKPVTAGGAGGKKYQAQHINLANNKQPKPEVAPPVKFQQNRRIEGSDR